MVNDFFSVLLPINVVIAFLSPLRAITLERDPSKRSKELISKSMQRILRVITLQGAIEISQILLSQYWKINNRMAA